MLIREYQLLIEDRIKLKKIVRDAVIIANDAAKARTNLRDQLPRPTRSIPRLRQRERPQSSQKNWQKQQSTNL